VQKYVNIFDIPISLDKNNIHLAIFLFLQLINKVMNSYKIYVAGKFIETSAILNVSNSFDGKVFAQTFLAGKKELEMAIQKAEEVKEILKQIPSFQRYNALMEIASKLRERIELHSEILALEACKPVKLARMEVERAINAFVVAAEEAKRLPGEYLSIDWTVAGTGKEGWVKYFPVGLIAGIAPFNFPLNLAVHKIAPAIAAGCPIILKPARSTPLSTLLLAEIIDETSLPKGALSVLPMNREAGNQLVTDERFKLLTFTGSPEVGWKMKQDAGKKKVVLELGGNAGVIVTETSDMDLAVKKCLGGGFAYMGQVCIRAQRIFVHYTKYEEFISKYIPLVQKLKHGNPLDSETEMSAMIDESNAIRVEEWVLEAISMGAKLLTGGKREGALVQPVVLTSTNTSMKVNSQEIFGPVVIIESYQNFDEAVSMINNSRYGLQAGVFTNRIDEMNQAFNQIETGGVIINDVPTFRADHMPYGGVKDSGLGREGIKYAILDMLEPKILVKNN